ncbi:MAG: DRTGG domain-containing protein [Dehalococcoidia bacterium]
MSTLLIASLASGDGRTTVAASLGASLAQDGLRVLLLRVRSSSDPDAAAEDDARALATVPGCAGRAAVSEQDALAHAAETDVCVIEAPAGPPGELASRLSAKVILVGQAADDQRLADLKTTAASFGDALVGVIITRQPVRRLASVRTALEERGLTSLGVLPEDRLLAGPTVRELAEALHASPLFENGEQDEAVEHVMIGPISSDPGQPYFLQHGSKAVIHRSDKMDLHLAALATEPECLILTGVQQPSPYLIDRLAGGDLEITVLQVPATTSNAVEALDDLYTSTRFTGRRKLERAIELCREHVDMARLRAALR